MYSQFMKKKIVNIWGENFTEALKKNMAEPNSSFIHCIEENKKTSCTSFKNDSVSTKNKEKVSF